MVALRSQGNWRWEGPLGTPLGLVHWKRASSPVEAGTAGYLCFQTPIAGSLPHLQLRQEPQGTSDFRLRSQGPCRLGASPTAPRSKSSGKRKILCREEILKQEKLSAEFFRSQAKKCNFIHFGFGTWFRSQNSSRAAQATHIQKPMAFEAETSERSAIPSSEMRSSHFR